MQWPMCSAFWTLNQMIWTMVSKKKIHTFLRHETVLAKIERIFSAKTLWITARISKFVTNSWKSTSRILNTNHWFALYSKHIKTDSTIDKKCFLSFIFVTCKSKIKPSINYPQTVWQNVLMERESKFRSLFEPPI